jgi:hypothetical protein
MRNEKGQFIKGLSPWNKGKKGFNPSPDTQFTSGDHHTGETHNSWKGGVQVMKKDCVHLWDGTGKRARRPRVVYEMYHGPIPKGYVIIHKDGDRHNDHPSNLMAISRSENLKRNRKRI